MPKDGFGRFQSLVDNVTGVGHQVDNNKQVIIGAAAVLLLLVGFISGPKVISSFRAKGAVSTAAKQPAEPVQPPLLKEADLIGSIWNVTVQGFTLKVSLNANGQAVAGSDNMIVRQLAKAKYGVESLPGKWSIEGPKLIVSTSFEGKEYTTALTISGTKLVSKDGVPIVRVK